MKKPLLITLLIVLFLAAGALGGFYFYVRAQQDSTTATAAAKGSGQAAPSFGGASGSTYQNIISSISESLGSFGKRSSATTTSYLWHVSSAPVAGFGWGSGSTLTYVERATGYVYSADAESHSIVRDSGTLTPKIYEAFVSTDGSLIERSIDQSGSITTTSLQATVGTSTQENAPRLSSTQLPKDLVSFAVNTRTKTIAYLVANAQGGWDLFIANWDGTNAKKIFSSPLYGWRLYPSDTSTLIVQRAADDVPGYAYRIDNKTGAVTSLVTGPGLVIAPGPTPSRYAFSTSLNGSLSLSLAATTTPRSTPTQTIAEKCVWLPGSGSTLYCAAPSVIPPSSFLDRWYRGEIHTNDAWWSIDTASGQAQEIRQDAAGTGALDVRDPQIDPTGNYVAFINNADESLWVFKLIR